ncbi:MAG: hypothetical protein IT208_13075 [Chthonomonadales bacterium]|nr:hypothetical protein [Chthonomonadales bacterium]
MGTSPDARETCEQLRVSRAEAVRALDDLLESGREMGREAMHSNVPLAHARARLAGWTSRAKGRLRDLFIAPTVADVYQMAVDGLSATTPYTGGASRDDGAARIRRAMGRRLDELARLRRWLDQCH